MSDRHEKYASEMRRHRVECYCIFVPPVAGRPVESFGWQCLTCGVEKQPFTDSLIVAEQDALTHYAEVILPLVDEEVVVGRAQHFDECELLERTVQILNTLRGRP